MSLKNIIGLLFMSMFGVVSCVANPELDRSSSNDSPKRIGGDEENVFFLVGEWRSGIRYLHSIVNINSVVIKGFPRLKNEDVSSFVTNPVNGICNKAGYEIRTKHVLIPIRCLAVWKDSHAYSMGNDLKLACKVNEREFDVNTDFNANVLDIEVKDKLSFRQAGSWSFVSLSEVRKHGVEVFHTDKSIPAYSK